MIMSHTNEEWVLALSTKGSQQSEALIELRELLLRATSYTLITHLPDLNHLEEHERMALAEDCAQDALELVLSNLKDFRGESKFTTWVYKFGVNIALTRARKERWKTISLDVDSEEEDTLDWLQWKEKLQTSDSEMPAMQSEIVAVIQEVIRSELTARQRQVLRWIAFDGVPMDVVVERLDANRNAVYKMLHDARVKIKRQLAAHGYELEEIYELFHSQ